MTDIWAAACFWLRHCFEFYIPFSTRLTQASQQILSPFATYHELMWLMWNWFNDQHHQLSIQPSSNQIKASVPPLIKLEHDWKFPYSLSPCPPVGMWSSPEVICLSVNYTGARITQADLLPLLWPSSIPFLSCTKQVEINDQLWAIHSII